MSPGDLFQFNEIADIHAWAIISDPIRFPDEVLIVNFTSYDPRVDQTCVFPAGAHPFITNRTCVNFPRARVTTDAILEQLRAVGRLRFHQSLSPAMLKEIREAAMLSTKIALAHADILIRQGLVED
jgi:hypothetical protein